MAKSIWEGWRFVGQNRVVRGITIGMIGAFAGAGVVVGLGYVLREGHAARWRRRLGRGLRGDLRRAGRRHAVGLRLLREFSRRRLFGLAIAVAAVPLALIALIPNLVVVSSWSCCSASSPAIAYVTGYTIIGREVDDDTRGRTFAFLQSAIRVVMFAVIAIAAVAGGRLSPRGPGDSGSSTVRIGNVHYGDVGNQRRAAARRRRWRWCSA